MVTVIGILWYKVYQPMTNLLSREKHTTSSKFVKEALNVLVAIQKED